MVFFDGAQDRLHLSQRVVESRNPALLHLGQGPATALGQPPQDTRFVGIPNGQLLRCGIGREHPLVDKANAMRLLDHQLVELVDPRFAQRRIGPRDIGVIANLRLGIAVTSNEDPRHHVLGHVRFHLARIEGLDQHQHYQGHIQGDIPGQPWPPVDVFAVLTPVACHGLGDRFPGQSLLQQEQGMGERDLDLNKLNAWTCLGTSRGHRMSTCFHGMLLVD